MFLQVGFHHPGRVLPVRHHPAEEQAEKRLEGQEVGRGDPSGPGPGSYHSLRAILLSNTRMEPSPSPATINERWESQDRLVTQLSAPVGMSWGESTKQPSWEQRASARHRSQGLKPDGPRVLLLFLSPSVNRSKTHPRFPPVTRTPRRGQVFLQALWT